MTGDERNKRTKYAMAGVGAIALATMGAIGAMMGGASASGAVIGPVPAAGETVTKTTAPSELETSFAKPTVKVELPDGYGN
ncbi:hypothetical protein [Mycolicibacterium neworleansense]|uniref:Uncharacterized protein n=1 Tax=Mycolicibacterium neworleansense TaxID=146018 RepID=A0A0H5RVW5_9MYCO|nr:hypothetical protein [Mycolicibacterium neworleansense]CRZ18063.1 hypothetical protein BN2156_04964 [Mycolicibacterium neworleansense]